eukprot:1236637-Rhodomonas_salina.6
MHHAHSGVEWCSWYDSWSSSAMEPGSGLAIFAAADDGDGSSRGARTRRCSRWEGRTGVLSSSLRAVAEAQY